MKHIVLLPQDAAVQIRQYLGQRPHDEVSHQVRALETSPGIVEETIFYMMDQLILSGQIPQERVPALVNSVPGFAAWRQLRSEADV